ncbi:MAG: delta-60 repeat domain-containing protein [Solirubrobacterales bacterium]
MSLLAKIEGRLGGLVAVLAVAIFAVGVGAALAADPTDSGFGTNGIAEIEAFVPGKFSWEDQVGGIVDLEPAGGGKLLAAVYPIALNGHYFAAARIDQDGSLDKSFGEGGFTPDIGVSQRKGEVEGGVLQAEAVVQQKDGAVVLAGYFENEGALAPALARFTSQGRLDPSFGNGGKVVPRPSNEGKVLRVGEIGGERLHDVAVEPDGTIVGVGEVVPGHRFDLRSPKQPAAVVLAYRPDGKVERRFGHRGRFEVKMPRSGAYTGFTEVKALPSGKLLVSGYVGNQIVLYRLTANGKPDPSFGGGDGKVTLGRRTGEASPGFIRAPFAVERGGRIVLCGVTFSKSILDSQPVVLVRFSADGRRDRSFGKSIYAEQAPADRRPPLAHRKHVEAYQFDPQGLAIDGKGRIVVTGGEAAPYVRGQKEAGYAYFVARRFLPNGRRDKGFGESGVFPTDPPGSQSYARAATTQPGGKVVAGGWVQIERFGGNGPGNTAMMLTRYR